MEHTFDAGEKRFPDMKHSVMKTSKHEDEFNAEELHLSLKKFYSNAQEKRELSLGYPVNQKIDYSALSPFLNIHLNNAGDPYAANGTILNTRNLERDVLEYFAQLWNASSRNPLTSQSYWGYILGMGATEGNMYALWSAREYFQTKLHSPKIGSAVIRAPILFYSQEAHYSLNKCAKVLRIDSFQEVGKKFYPDRCPVTADGQWPPGVPVDQYGAVDPELLSRLVNFFAANGHPPIIVLNEGTTFQGAFDDPQAVWESLYPVLKAHGFCLKTDSDNCPDFWIHIDGALGAAYLPYLEIAYEKGLASKKGPCFDFRLPFVSSVVMSTHKWYGAPFASGIFMSKEKYRMQPATLPEYIDSPDTTLCGSRNGFSALLLWYAIRAANQYEQVKTAAECMKMAEYAYEQLQTVKAIHPSFQIMKGPLSLVVLFSRPNNEIFNKFHLSGRGDFAHIVAMPHVTQTAINKLIRALHDIDAFE